ncbi:hypothetical protein C7M84_024392 [Penaeus vannamei]|uniref:VWFC domain-containing protein n=1 Tax=Penaeus vannamei TaxID=6689 RepID=A0A3R7SYZ4_PENVA|nr:hypothetical protein C7M84_024392 [Penaeus vannamei]
MKPDAPAVDVDETATDAPTVDTNETTTDGTATDVPAIDTGITTDAPTAETATVLPEDSSMCYVNGTSYSNNSIVPAYTPCQESCRCINGAVSCKLVACPPAPPAFLRCTSAPVEGECCPSHTCPPVKPDTTETPGCVSDGVQYYDGEFVPSSDLCSDCYCLGGEVICAILECPQPQGQNCTAVERPLGSCCPTKYECDEVDMPDSLSQVTDADSEGKVTPSSTFTIGVDESHTEATSQAGEDVTSTKAPVDGAVEEPVTPASTDGEVPVESTLSTGSPDDMMTGPVIGLETRTTAPDDYSVLTTPMTTITEDVSTQTESPVDQSSVDITDETTSIPETDDTTVMETADPEIGKTTGTPAVEATSEVPIVDETGTESPELERPVTDIPTVVAVTDVPDDKEPTTETPLEIETGTDSPTGDQIATGVPTLGEVTTDVDETATGIPAVDTDGTDMVTDIPEEVISTVSLPDKEGIPGEGSCMANGTTYSNGDNVPASRPCHQLCTCKNSIVSCELQACPPPPPAFLRCAPVEDPEQCCPSYDCPTVEPDTTEYPGCLRDGIQYLEGEYVPSPDICTDCYCLSGEIICAVLECPVPAGANCKPMSRATDSCCPSKYECDDLETDTDAVNQTVTDAPTGIDETATEVDQTTTDAPVEVDQTSTDAPV